MRKKGALERAVKAHADRQESVEEIEVMVELSAEASEEEKKGLLSETTGLLESTEERWRSLETQRLLGEEGDEASAILEINSGAGGTDASDWAEMLKRMYLRWAERRGYGARVVEETPHDEAGIKSCTLALEGPYAYGYLKAEIGVHRLVQVPLRVALAWVDRRVDGDVSARLPVTSGDEAESWRRRSTP